MSLITPCFYRERVGVKVCNFWWFPSFLRRGFLWPLAQHRSWKLCASGPSATLNIFGTPLRTWRSPPSATEDAPCRGYEQFACHRIPLPSYEVALTPWRKPLFGTIVFSQLFKEFAEFYGNRRFITLFKRDYVGPWPERDESTFFNIKHVVPKTKILYLPQVVRCGMSKVSGQNESLTKHVSFQATKTSIRHSSCSDTRCYVLSLHLLLTNWPITYGAVRTCVVTFNFNNLLTIDSTHGARWSWPHWCDENNETCLICMTVLMWRHIAPTGNFTVESNVSRK